MEELRDKNFRDKYIVEKTREILGVESGAIDFIDVGALNYVYRVVTKNGILFFKQALERAKGEGRIGRDLALISKERIRYEKNFINAVGAKMPQEITLPCIYQYDEENNILIMGDAAIGGVLLESALLEGDFNASVAANIGRFLGIAHKETFGRKVIIRGSEQEDKNNWKIFLNMRTRGINADEPAKTELAGLFEGALKNHTYNVLINMDCCPKNIFQRQNGSIGLIDFELASGCGDPAYDLGFALGHYFLFSVLGNVSGNAIKCFESMVSAYMGEFGSSLDKDGLKRAIKYAGAVLIYRVAGSSPAPYIPKDKIGDLKNKGSAIVTSDSKTIDEAVGIIKNTEAI